ncbi:MAG: alkaline phosphatase family protein [Candidatus Omnitrophota bacterium]
MSTYSKILFIGMDAGDKDLILGWAREGVLPAFERLLKESAWGITKNPPGLFVGAVWPSFATGASPSKHGRYSPKQFVPGTYEFQKLRLSEMKEPLFWETLSRAGKRMAVIDVPRVRLAREFKGVQLFNWLSHDPEPEGFVTSPEELAEEVKRKYGLNSIPRCDGKRAIPEEFRELRDALIKRVGQKREFSRDLLRRDAWDFFLTVFTESHCAGHQFWALRDPSHPKHDPEIAACLGDPMRDVYREIDASIGNLLDEVGPDTAVFVLASHGMGPHFDGTAILEEMLTRMETRYDPWMRFRTKKSRFGHRLCFKVPNNTVYGGIRINLAGREPQGRVKPGAAYERLRNRLIRDLGEFINLETKEPAVEKVHRIETLYPDEDTSFFPDLIVEWNRRARISSVFSPKTGRIDGKYQGCRTGDHKPEGLFFMKGPGIPVGRLEGAVSVMDFAPTFAELLGVPMPSARGRSLFSNLTVPNAD